MVDQYAVVGNPIAHSLSPQIHAWFARETGQKLHYSTLCPSAEAFASTVREFFDHDGKGLNITLPYKQAAAALCQQMTTVVETTGAANTLWQNDGQLCGDSTDGPGLLTDLQQRLRWSVACAHLLILGAGGTCASILPSLIAAQPASIHIANRTLTTATTLAQRYRSQTPIPITASDFQFPCKTFDLCINTTPVSLQSQLVDLTEQQWRQCLAYYDCAYGSKVVPVLKQLKAYGMQQCADGLGMLVEQAALSFARWRKITPPTQGIYQHLRQQFPDVGRDSL